jgi:ribonuclease PH
MTKPRSFERPHNGLRPVTLQAGISRHAEGSCMVSFGNTKVLCTASVESNPPSFLRGTGQGWVTAEYGMLPRSTGSRNPREAAKGKQSGRTQEIQRLIGRSLRAICDLSALGERQITIDCDVIEADGGTRTASITGAYVALAQAIHYMLQEKMITKNPLTSSVCAVSCGVVNGVALLDLDYSEDSTADVDANFVLAGDGNMIEIQSTAEKNTFSEAEFFSLLNLAKEASLTLTHLQNEAIATLQNV